MFCYYDKRGHYLCVKLHLCTEQLGVKTHQLSIPVMEVALNTDQKELSLKISLEFLQINFQNYRRMNGLTQSFPTSTIELWCLMQSCRTCKGKQNQQCGHAFT